MYVETEETLPPRTLAAFYRALNERTREAYERDRAVREKAGAFLEERTKWDRVRENIKAAGAESAKPTPDNNEVRVLLKSALAAVTPVPEIGEEMPVPEEYEGVTVTLRVVSQLRYSVLDRPIALAADIADPRERDEAVIRGMRAFVAETVAEVRGLKARDDTDVEIAGHPLDSRALDILEVCGLLVPLFNVAKGAQSLDPFLRAGYGSSPPSTSPTASSTAPDAQAGIDSGRAATEGRGASTSPGTATSPTPALDGSTPPPESMPPSPGSPPPRGGSGQAQMSG